MKFYSRSSLYSGLFVFVLLASRAGADVAKDGSKDLFRADVSPRSEFTTTGFVQATLYPMHAEYPANFGLPLKDEVTARYSLTTDITVEYVKAGIFGELYLFLPMGDTRPKHSYNYRADPILLEVQPTLGYTWTPHMDVRVTYDDSFDLNRFTSKDEVTPWLSLSMRYGTTKPVDLGRFLALSGYVEPSFFVPGYEFPATPGATPVGYPVKDFSRAQIVNARYALGFNMRLQPKMKYADHFFVFANPELFFGDATLADHDRFGGKPLTVYLEFGAGVEFTKNLELRWTHAEFDSMGGAPPGLLNLKGEGVSLRYSW